MQEPLWFSKNGENRIGFNYANSSWHRKLMETSSGSGSGSGSNNEKRGRKFRHNGPGSPGQSHTNSSRSDTVVAHHTSKKRSGSESPVDPMLFTSNRNSKINHSPTNTLTTTVSSLHKKGSRRSDQYTLTTHIPSPSTEWFDTYLAPAPRHISRPPSQEHRPCTSHSTASQRHRAAPLTPQRSSDRPRTGESGALSFSYPGRTRSNRLIRTESGDETYGVGSEEEVRRELGSRGSERVARGPGRAY